MSARRRTSGREKRRTPKLRRSAQLLLGAMLTGASWVACTLNPQPIPPGDQPDSGGVSFPRGDSGAMLPRDAGDASPTDADAGPADAGVDASSDAGAADANDGD
ncbi:hypothetical protein [Pendulispora albinea]|uniref:Uncharacterized protein n=1 Tax=Pendulispora albinea TaxID=2741071 RepID=A0ABZ2M038_9BACT